MQNESEAGNATRKSQKQRLTKKKIKSTRRLVGATSTNPTKNTEKVRHPTRRFVVRRIVCSDYAVIEVVNLLWRLFFIHINRFTPLT